MLLIPLLAMLLTFTVYDYGCDSCIVVDVAAAAAAVVGVVAIAVWLF